MAAIHELKEKLKNKENIFYLLLNIMKNILLEKMVSM